ncbi:farnesyltranstransferase [Iodidimonas nitroreducens]|uniref:Octaprenyl diphosphate synthase n=1 Tax=Iodidimonas nitroreducens TaxID=1236968 RepID=A0A5A7N7J8_9PROT|nr:polyprenyl synthetase family protein [Iodidimonas nitroreducens]GAK33193.1 octaprenyl-diphosphate synthase [alpha proteobacterium Q-1]GER04303.1 farnesyltranstransferase [Iodidimonas nitroreducens]
MANIASIDQHKKGRAVNSVDEALECLQTQVSADMARVNETILARMHSPVALIPQLAGHLIASGGKRLRPMLTLAGAQLVDYKGDRHTKLAACVEFIHTATLLHDDVVDESDLRRGKDSANVLWGNKPSVLVGDFLFSRAFELMIEDGSLKVLKLLSHASSVIAEGEVLQLSISNDLDTPEESYLQVIEAKTAALFEAATQIAAVVAERPENEELALASFGRHFGIAFQLVDDALDYSARQATLGKTVGDDFREGKITLPVILAFRRGDETERAFWRRTIEEMDQKEGDLSHAIHLMETHEALSDTIERARHYGAIARDALALFKPNNTRKTLNDIVRFCVERAY